MFRDIQNEWPGRNGIPIWVVECDRAITELLPLYKPIARFDGFDEHQRGTLGALSTAALRASGSAIILLENYRVWDADIIMRSVVEASLKFTYLLSRREDFDQRFIEYSSMLPDIADLKNHLKAQEAIQALGAQCHQAISDLLLPPDEIEKLKQKYPSNVRRETESKWSFSRLLASIAAEPLPYAGMFMALAHGYSMNSRILHADWYGVSMVMERDHRQELGRTATDTAHAARIISDIFWFTVLRLSTGYRFIGEPATPIIAATKKFEALQAELLKAQTVWNDIEYGARSGEQVG